MGNPNWSYEEMLREADRIMSNKVETQLSISEIEKRVQSYPHNNEFYFNCGFAASNIINNILEKGGCDDLNASIGGLEMFSSFIGLGNEKRSDFVIPKICDKNIIELELGDKVSLFGKTGEVVYDCGAYGIYFKEGIDWDLIKSKIPEVTECNNTPLFCHNETFISFWELMWNFNCVIEDVCEVVEKI